MPTLPGWTIALLLLAAPRATASQTIPFQIEQNLLTVEVEVSGHRLPLMLDLGDFRALSLSPAVLDTVPVEFTGGVDTFVNYLGNQMEARRFLARDVRLGGLRFDEVKGSEDVHDPSNPSPYAYGAVGIGLFGGKVLTLDYADSTITVEEAGAEPSDCIALDTSLGMMTLEVDLDGETVTLLLDTGAQVSVLDEALFPETGKVYGEYSGHAIEAMAIGGANHGGHTFLRVPLGAQGFVGILGTDFLQRYRVRLDLEHGCAALVLP